LEVKINHAEAAKYATTTKAPGKDKFVLYND
jgi:hypothetical protein